MEQVSSSMTTSLLAVTDNQSIIPDFPLPSTLLTWEPIYLEISECRITVSLFYCTPFSKRDREIVDISYPKKKGGGNEKHDHRDMAVAPWQKLAMPLQESEMGLTGRNTVLLKEQEEE